MARSPQLLPVPIPVPSHAGLLSAGPGTLGLSQQQLMQCGDEQSPQPRSSARGDTGSLGGLAGAAPPAPSRTARHTETPLPTPPTRWEYPRERGSPFLPSAPRHRHVPSAPKPTAHPTPPLAPPQAHRRPLPTPAPNFPRHPKSPTKLPGEGTGVGTRGRAPYSRARGAARCPRGGGGGSASRSALLAARLRLLGARLPTARAARAGFM